MESVICPVLASVLASYPEEPCWMFKKPYTHQHLAS